MAAFLVMLREGVEAALVVAILLAYLTRLGRRAEARWVWSGTAAAAAVSLAAGSALWVTVGELHGDAEALAEALIAVSASGLLTWMIFWMGRQARSLRTALHSRVDSALAAGGSGALAMVAFIAVAREGLESALFLISTTVGTGADLRQLLGGLAGVVAAAAVGYLVYRGSRVIDLRVFFRVTGILILVFAAGLAAKAVHELQDLGALPLIREHIWTLTVFDPSTTLTGRFLESLFGWDPAPSLLMVAGYLAYLLPVGWSFLGMTKGTPHTAPVGSSAAAS